MKTAARLKLEPKLVDGARLELTERQRAVGHKLVGRQSRVVEYSQVNAAAREQMPTLELFVVCWILSARLGLGASHVHVVNVEGDVWRDAEAFVGVLKYARRVVGGLEALGFDYFNFNDAIELSHSRWVLMLCWVLRMFVCVCMFVSVFVSVIVLIR